jgi:hypothetical protein
MVKIADSAMMNANIPTRPREGSVQGGTMAGIATGIVLITRISNPGPQDA